MVRTPVRDETANVWPHSSLQHHQSLSKISSTDRRENAYLLVDKLNRRAKLPCRRKEDEAQERPKLYPSLMVVRLQRIPVPMLSIELAASRG
jgi:hypothetical protein